MTTKAQRGIAVWILIGALGAGGWAWREQERKKEAERAHEMLKRENAQWAAQRQAREFQQARAECTAEELKAELKALAPRVQPAQGNGATAEPGVPRATGKNGSWVHAIRSDPEVQALEVAAARGRLEAQFGLLSKKLGLTPELQEKFYMNLMTREAKIADVRAAGEAKNLADTDEVVTRLTREAFTDCDKAQRELLGEAGYNQMKDYVAAMPVRELVSGLAVVATTAGVPLSADQRERLVPLMIEKASAGNSGAVMVSFENLDWTQMDAAVRTVLTDEQFTLFKTAEIRGSFGWSRFAEPLDKMVEQGRKADAVATGGPRPGGE